MLSLVCTIAPQWACSQAGPPLVPIILVTPWDRCLEMEGPVALSLQLTTLGRALAATIQAFSHFSFHVPFGWVAGLHL